MGKLRIGTAIKNPANRPAYDWAMKNVYTGKIEFPYQMNVIVPNTDFKRVTIKIDYE